MQVLKVDQSERAIKQNQNKRDVTFDAKLKTAPNTNQINRITSSHKLQELLFNLTISSQLLTRSVKLHVQR